MTRVDPRTQVRGPELAGAVAQGDVRRREPESQGGPEPSDRGRDRQEEQKTEKTEEKEAAAGGTCKGRERTDAGQPSRRGQGGSCVLRRCTGTARSRPNRQ